MISNLPSKLLVQPAGGAPGGEILSVTPWGMAKAAPTSEARAYVVFILKELLVRGGAGELGTEAMLAEKCVQQEVWCRQVMMMMMEKGMDPEMPNGNLLLYLTRRLLLGSKPRGMVVAAVTLGRRD